MDERQWLSCTDPTPMLECLLNCQVASDRKLRFYACACVRRVWHLLENERCRELVQVAERVADGELGQQALDRADAALEAESLDAEGTLPRLDAQVIFL